MVFNNRKTQAMPPLSLLSTSEKPTIDILCNMPKAFDSEAYDFCDDDTIELRPICVKIDNKY